jgi:hypothetical protein
VSPITVVVGASEHLFFIHSAVLEKSSEFFGAALKSGWIEGHEHQVKLPEDDPRVFKTYANWLYTGTLQSLEYLELAKLYLLGEKLIDSTFQDIIINAIVACSRKRHDGNRWFPVGTHCLNYLSKYTSRVTSAASVGKLLCHPRWAEVQCC